MAADNPPTMTKKRLGFMHLLSSAACEWFLMFLLFLNAALSHLLTKFAHYCELKTPCLLCSRLDNTFAKPKPGCYWNLLCNTHREEISCLVSCSIHAKFADVHSLCEECLAPIVSRSKSGSDSYRLLVGKSWLDVDRSVLQNLVLNKHVRLGSPDHRTCSCCGKTWRAKSSTERLLELNPVSYGASKANVKPPLPRPPGRSRFSRRDSLKRLRDKFAGQMPAVSTSVDTLSHVGYTKLKISSDSESEFPFSEDDDDSRSTTSRVNSCSGKNEYASDKQHSHPNLVELSEDKNANSLSVDVFRQHGLGDLDWEESFKKPSPSLSPDLISLNDGLQQFDVVGGAFGAPALSILSELLSLCNAPLSSSACTTPKKIDVVETSEKGDTSAAQDIDASVETSPDDDRSLESTIMHRTDASTQTDETSELSDTRGLETTNTSDSAKTEEDIKSTPQVFTSKETSPISLDKQEDKPRIEEEVSSSKKLPVSTSPKKKGSNYESSDATTSNDIEGENIVDNLKRQVEHDRNLLNTLYKDLEEERNAAAIAANQAMAMITRLQEEKAALHMEALQYLRMMEEQAEYDMEALGRANDLLSEKEKELQDLEIELEFYRNNFLDESAVHNLQSETSFVQNRVGGVTETSPGVSSDLKTVVLPKENGICEPMNISLSNFEDEKVYILQCLKKLEKKLHQAYSCGECDDLPNGVHSEKYKIEIDNLEDLFPYHGTLSNHENGDVENIIPLSNGNPDHNTTPNGDPAHGKENDRLREKRLENRGEINFAKIEKEIAELYDRLEALEADQDFIKHISDLLRNGKDGLVLVQEIAHQLHEFRKMEFRKR